MNTRTRPNLAGALLLAVVLASAITALPTAETTASAAASAAAPSANGGPLTFDQARARGTTVDWGPKCDTTTGKVAVPSGYAPPCVRPWQGGDNGGETAPGVTAQSIRVVLYQAQPDLLQQAFFEATGSDESLEAERRTTQAYVDYFSEHYELYGRSVELVTLKASGPPDDAIAAKADAITVASELHAFASFGGPSQTSAYASELARRGVLCVGDCLVAEPQRFLDRYRPYLWPTLPSPEQASQHWADFVGTQLAEGNAIYAGEALARDKRKFGIVHYDDDAGTFRASVAAFTKSLARDKVHPVVTIAYSADLDTATSHAALVIAKLKNAGVTSVLLAADPIFPAILTAEATKQNYFPEWVVLGYAFTDTAVFGRQYDQQQWQHAIGVSLLPARTTDEVDELGNLVTWQTGEPPEAKTFRELVQAPLIFFTGLHLAGAHLTAKTFAAGLSRFPSEPSTTATRLHLSWGRHGIWKGIDVTGGDDATAIWWDPHARGPDEVGRDGDGLYRYADGGARYLPGQWPHEAVGLHDDATSVTVLSSLPPEDQPPSYPSPA